MTHKNRLFLTILQGPNPREASPILATEDQDLIRAVARALADRLESGQSPNRPPLALLEDLDEEPGS